MASDKYQMVVNAFEVEAIAEEPDRAGQVFIGSFLPSAQELSVKKMNGVYFGSYMLGVAREYKLVWWRR